MLEVVRHLESKSAMDLIAGIGFKREGKLVFTAERPLRPLVDMPPKAYHLADFDAYERVCGRRWAMYTSSLACPFNCAYCTNAGVYGRKWNALPAEQFVEETVDLTRRYNLEMLWVVDDNFLVDLDRARAISEGLVRAGSSYQWSIQATTNLVARLSIDDLKLLKRAGLQQICQGAESGSTKVLEAMNKDFQNFESIYESAARCLKPEYVRRSISFLHFPAKALRNGETPFASFSTCAPLPGSRILDQHLHAVSRSAGHASAPKRSASMCPTSFEGWVDFFPRYTELPWLKGREHRRLQITRDYLRIAFDRIPIAAQRRNTFTRLAQKCISIPARWRLE